MSIFSTPTQKMIVDEADVDMQRNSSRRSNEQNYAAYKMPSRKRKAGPLPRSYVHKRIRYNSMSPTSTPPASPASSVSSCSSSDLSPPNSPMSNASEIIISCDSGNLTREFYYLFVYCFKFFTLNFLLIYKSARPHTCVCVVLSGIL